MKKIILIITLLVILFSCKKEITSDVAINPLSKIQDQLKDSISNGEYEKLDWTHSIKTISGNEATEILRIPFYGKSIENDFLLLEIKSEQQFLSGKIIHIVEAQKNNNAQKIKGYNGSIELYSLKGILIKSSEISGGIAKEFRTTNNTSSIKALDEPDIPVVIDMGFLPWYNINSMLYGDGSGYSNTGYYSPGGGGGASSPPPNTVVSVDFEIVEDNPSIDLTKYLNCFDNLSDVGATFTISILTDIPVDNSPTTFFDWDNQSPGHTFLQIVKTNGSQTVKQFIGFYPVSGWKTILTPNPIDGKFADNQHHESNASISINLTADKFRSTLSHMQYLANFIKYDIDEYNCTDFALGVFNYARGSHPLEIPLHYIPNGITPTSTPQGLYQKLVLLKEGGGPESNNILIPAGKTFAGTSKGPCN